MTGWELGLVVLFFVELQIGLGEVVFSMRRSETFDAR